MARSKSLAGAGQVLAAIVILFFCMVPTSDALWVGGNIDVHNNTGQDAHDFHIEGKIKSTTPPILMIEIGYVVTPDGNVIDFPNFDHAISHAGGDLWDFKAAWWMDPDVVIPPSSVGHFGLFF